MLTSESYDSLSEALSREWILCVCSIWSQAPNVPTRGSEINAPSDRVVMRKGWNRILAVHCSGCDSGMIGDMGKSSGRRSVYAKADEDMWEFAVMGSPSEVSIEVGGHDSIEVASFPSIPISPLITVSVRVTVHMTMSLQGNCVTFVGTSWTLICLEKLMISHKPIQECPGEPAQQWQRGGRK
jgi:hypothetical protein